MTHLNHWFHRLSKERATAVETTNDSSTISKLSACNAGYIVDEHLKYFVERPTRRAPLIHRGYYIRWKGVEHVKRVCTERLSNCNMQLILFGAGYDTSVFRFHSENVLQWKVYEVDFPTVQCRKLHTILKNQQLYNCTGELRCVSDCLVQSSRYSAIMCDICDLKALHTNLERAGVDFNAPTLFLSECVLTYINATSVDALLAWCGTSFSNAVFCTYEQIQLQDAFGQIMKKHFERVRSPLKNMDIYPNAEFQKRRYLSAGWDFCKSCDMTVFFDWLSEDEKQRVADLELFDEYEEWRLTCSHYMILCAFKGELSALKEVVLPMCTVNYNIKDQLVYYTWNLRMQTLSSSSCSLKRYGHGSCLLSNSSIVIVGGFGESSSERAAPHARLNDALELVSDRQGWKLCGLSSHGDTPGLIMHHTVTAIHNGTAALVIGGRSSPACPNDTMFVLKISASGSAHWSKVVLHPDSSAMEPRWRHTANCISDNDEECVLIVGGSSTSTCAVADIYKLSTVTWRMEKLCVSLPEGRCSHTCVASQGGLIIFGGMDSSLKPISSCLYLSHPLRDVWNLSELQFRPPLPPKYSMSAVVIGKHAILFGGVGLPTSPDIIVVDLNFPLWFGVMVSCEDEVLLSKHTCHLVAGQKLVVIGGGGNCFSFGTHFNSGLYTLDTSYFFCTPS